MELVSKELDFAIDAVKKAGQITLEFFQSPKLSIDEKKDGSPVTQADKNAEEFLREAIQKAFPEDTIIGEEFGIQSGKDERSWVIDPIDGTVSFIHGVPTYSTLLGLGNPETNEWDLGIIYLPALREMIYAEKGKGCWRLLEGAGKPHKIQTSSVDTLSDSTVVATGADYVPEAVIQSAKVFRTWGDGYGYVLLASGQVEVMLDADISVWDAAPLYTVVPEAGGRLVNWSEKGKGQTKGAPQKTGAVNGAVSKSLGKHLEMLDI